MVDANSKVEMKKKRKLEDDQQHTTDSTSSRISFPPDGYICNLCQQTGHWIQQCPERNKMNRQKRRKKNTEHIPIPGVDPSQTDIKAAQKYQKWLTTHESPKCFCGNPSRLKKVKKKNTQTRAGGNYFFFCQTAKGENPCRFAKLVDDVIKEQKRKEKKTITNGMSETP